MTYEELFEFVDAEPFRPFRIQMVSGRKFDVRHPEMVRIGMNAVVVFYFSDEIDRVYERFHMLGLQLIESIEPLDMPVAQDQER